MRLKIFYKFNGRTIHSLQSTLQTINRTLCSVIRRHYKGQYCSPRDLHRISDLYRRYLTKSNPSEGTKIVQNAINIYYQIETKDHDYIAEITHQLLSICIRYQCPDHVISIWNQIKFQHTDSSPVLPHQLRVLFLRCFIMSNESTMDYCFEVIRSSSTTKSFPLRCREITKLIQKCDAIESLQFIATRIKQQKIKINDQTPGIIVSTALIDRFCKFGDIQSALNIFHSIDDNQMNTVCVRVLFSGLINNEQSHSVLRIYRRPNLPKDASVHALALKACCDCNDFKTGQQIIEMIECQQLLDSDDALKGMDVLRLKTSLIDFYGFFKDIDSAQRMFNSIEQRYRDIAVINSMLKALGNNGQMDVAKQIFIEYREMADKQTLIVFLSGMDHSESSSAEDMIQIWEGIECKELQYDLLVMSALIDGLSRKGFVYAAFDFAEEYRRFTGKKDEVIYTSILSACRNTENVLLAKLICVKLKCVKMSENRKASIQRLVTMS